jgi:hypothetical protein
MVATSGCLNSFQDPIPPHVMRISGIDVAAPTVSSGTVDLVVNVTLDNTGGRSPPVRVQVKAFDTSTQLLVVTNDVSVGRLQKDETRSVSLAIRVPRASGYEIAVAIFEDERIVQTGSVRLNNVGGLERNLFDTGLRIADMDFLVRNVSASRAVIEAKIYVTNEARSASKALKMQVKARDVATGLLADEKWTDLASVQPEESKPTAVSLDIPGGHNYEVEAVLWDHEFIVERGHGKVQLLPTFTKPSGQDLVVSSPQISDFIRPQPGATGQTKTPGLGALAVLGVLVACILIRRSLVR